MEYEILVSALIVAIIGAMVDLDSTAAWQIMISQPIVAAPLTGLFLGFITGQFINGLKLGLAVGTILQLVWIEQLPLGANIPPDAALASVLSVALGYLAGYKLETYVEKEVCTTIAILVSVALGLWGRSLDIIVRRINTYIVKYIEQQIREGRYWVLSVGHGLAGFITFTKAFLFCFIITLVGVEPLRYFSQSLNLAQNAGFIVMQGILPAVGLSVLASMTISNVFDVKLALISVIIFTILPTSLWVILVSTFLVILYFLTNHRKNAKVK